MRSFEINKTSLSLKDRRFLSSLRTAHCEFCEVTNILRTDMATLIAFFFPWLDENYGVHLPIGSEKEVIISNEQKYFIFQIKFAGNE